jgi:hypothetical protein
VATEFPNFSIPVTPDDITKAKQLRALFCNKILIQPDGLHLRMTLGESVAGENLFHTSIVVPNGDAMEFGLLIAKMANEAIQRQAGTWVEPGAEDGQADG